MTLSVSIATAALVLRFTTPGAGSWYVFTLGDRAQIVAAGHETNACHVVFTLSVGGSMEFYRGAFFPD
jgi:hypothetical protein